MDKIELKELDISINEINVSLDIMDIPDTDNDMDISLDNLDINLKDFPDSNNSDITPLYVSLNDMDITGIFPDHDGCR